MAYIGSRPTSNFRVAPTKDTFTGDGSTTTFDLANKVPAGGENALQVFVENVRQEPGSGKAYTLGVDGSGDLKRITFSSAPVASAEIYVITTFSNEAFANIADYNGTELILDADGDTSFTADTDDQIDIKIAGADDFQFTANTFTVASGSKISGGGALTIDNASGDITIDAAGDILLDADDTDIILRDGGSTFGGFKQVSGGCQINGGTDASLTLTSDGRGLSQYTAKVWANLNGNSFGLRDSHNISSATDNGTGDYTFTFDNALANTNYAVVSTASNGTSHGDFQGVDAVVNATGNVRIYTCYVSATNSGSSAHNVLDLHIAIFGD